jgi:hypothetical protein
MMTLRQLAAEPPSIPTRAGWYLADLGEAKGKYELFTRQAPQKLKVLREHALIESAISSNRIECVEVEFILTRACKEFEERLGELKSLRGEKTALVGAAIERQTGAVGVSDLQNACPDVGVDLIRRVLKRLRGSRVVCLGRGQAAKWKKLGN